MTQIGTVYAQALYSLAKEEGLGLSVFEELKTLDASFREEPAFLRLLAAPNLSKEERCRVVDDCFRGKVQPYLLNFLKLLTEKGYVRHFHDCCEAYRQQYYQDNGILEVHAVTAVALNADQTNRLTEKLAGITGKTIVLDNLVDPACLGGMRLDYDGKRVDDTVQHRLDSIGALLKNTVL